MDDDPDKNPPSENRTEVLAALLQSPTPSVRRQGIEQLIRLDQDCGGRKVDPVGGQPLSGSTEPTHADAPSRARDRTPLGDLNALQILREHKQREPDATNRKIIDDHLSSRPF